MTEDFFATEQEISGILVQYMNLYQQYKVEIPVTELKNSIYDLYHKTTLYTDSCCAEVKQAVEFDLTRLEQDVVNQKAEEIVPDLHRLFLTLRTYAQLVQYMSLLFQKNKEREDLTVRRFLKKYEADEDKEKRELAAYVKKNGEAELFNYDFRDHYKAEDINLFYDESHKLFYTFYANKKMYLSRTYQTKKAATDYVVTLYQEQDAQSPHCYQNDGYEVKEGDIVIDAGVAEGNFALDVIDKVSKIYLVECDKDWIDALKLTFAPYKDKVVLVDRFLDSYDDDTHATIDTILEGNPVNYIKMDIEGAEIGALNGASHTLEQESDIRCNICSYHKMGDEEAIKDILKEHHFKVSTSNGYMFFKWNPDALLNLELRRGLTRGMK